MADWRPLEPSEYAEQRRPSPKNLQPSIAGVGVRPPPAISFKRMSVRKLILVLWSKQISPKNKFIYRPASRSSRRRPGVPVPALLLRPPGYTFPAPPERVSGSGCSRSATATELLDEVAGATVAAVQHHPCAGRWSCLTMHGNGLLDEAAE